MTDLEKFKELYASFGIDLKHDQLENGLIEVILCESSWCSCDIVNTSSKFEGYTGFFTQVIFDKDGKFIKQGFWE